MLTTLIVEVDSTEDDIDFVRLSENKNVEYIDSWW
jgi:hypothetical protein